MKDQLKVIARIALFMISALLLVWAFLPAYRTYASGFILGTLASLTNAWLLILKIETLSKLTEQEGRKRVNLGTLSRMCVALLAVMIAVKYPQFNLVFTIAGLFSVQLATLLMGYLFIKKNNHEILGKEENIRCIIFRCGKLAG